jgi:hypothetical protein
MGESMAMQTTRIGWLGQLGPPGVGEDPCLDRRGVGARSDDRGTLYDMTTAAARASQAGHQSVNRVVVNSWCPRARHRYLAAVEDNPDLLPTARDP